jgi:hypothetical protein
MSLWKNPKPAFFPWFTRRAARTVGKTADWLRHRNLRTT